MTARALAAELIGTFVLVLATCAAYLTAPPPAGTLAIALAAGLALTAMTGALGHVSGGHFNPAVTVGLVAAGRCESARLVGYIVAQVLGAIAAAWLLQVVASGGFAGVPRRDGQQAVLMLAANTYSEARGFTLVSAFVVEAAASAVLVLVAVGAGAHKAAAGIAPLAAGAALAALYVLAMPVTNGSLNPARSTAPAMLAGGVALSQLWVFWVAPVVGGIIGGALGKWLIDEDAGG